MSKPGAAFLLFLAVAACDAVRGSRLDETTALQVLRERYPARPVTLGAGDWDRLKSLGYLTENPRASFENRYSVTPAGTAAGLERVIERGPGRVTISFRGRVCEREVSGVTAITSRDSTADGPIEVAFVRRVVAPAAANPLFDADAVASACDTSRTWPDRALFIPDSAGWRIDQPPRLAQEMRMTTNYHYDLRGLLTGATSTARFSGWPEDPDGDSVSVRWLPPGDSVGRLIPYDSSGFDVSFEHLIIYGRPAGAQGRLMIADNWGVADTTPVGVDFR